MRAVAAVAAAAISLVAVVAPAVGSATRTTTLQDDFFTRKKLVVSKGTTVVWRWSTGEKHTVTDTKRRFTSKLTKTGDFRHRYRRAGTYRVYCKMHPTFMMQKIVVK